MRSLEITEIQNVSGASFWTGNCYVSVPSWGIPDDCYKVMDLAYKMYIEDKSTMDTMMYGLMMIGVPSQYVDQYFVYNMQDVYISCH